ncbi:MAG: endolytic transglycosylase MltG [Gammaproteobacteria bacterium]
MMRVLRWLLVTVLLVLVGLGSVAYVAHEKLSEPVVTGEAPLRLVIEPGMSFATVAKTLRDAGGYGSPTLLTYYARYREVADKVQAGEYLIAPNTGVHALFKQLVDGDVVLQSITVVEGWNFRELRAALAAHPDLRQTLPSRSDEEIMATLGVPDQHPEGRFFPDTYSFARGTTDLVILRNAHTAMIDRLASAWAGRTNDCPLTSPTQALILASIIEKETGRADERAQIAGVFCRRLTKGMRLQTDPTVIYGLGPTFNGDITRRDLRTDTPYNTYTRDGLPPTPIALPGADSLAAAVAPASGDTLYFVATGDGDGGHYFSKTLTEHNQALARYLKALRAPK